MGRCEEEEKMMVVAVVVMVMVAAKRGWENVVDRCTDGRVLSCAVLYRTVCSTCVGGQCAILGCQVIQRWSPFRYLLCGYRFNAMSRHAFESERLNVTTPTMLWPSWKLLCFAQLAIPSPSPCSFSHSMCRPGPVTSARCGTACAVLPTYCVGVSAGDQLWIFSTSI